MREFSADKGSRINSVLNTSTNISPRPISKVKCTPGPGEYQISFKLTKNCGPEYRIGN